MVTDLAPTGTDLTRDTAHRPPRAAVCAATRRGRRHAAPAARGEV